MPETDNMSSSKNKNQTTLGPVMRTVWAAYLMLMVIPLHPVFGQNRVRTWAPDSLSTTGTTRREARTRRSTLEPVSTRQAGQQRPGAETLETGKFRLHKLELPIGEESY